MSYETISCRMSRSDPSIRWGFTVRSQGQDVVIATVERDSLADKAGLQNGDIVDQVIFRVCKLVYYGNSEIDGRATELNMNLRRFMSHPPAIPWSLHEGPDNKLHVQGFGTDIPGVNPADNYNVSSRSEWSSGNPPPGFNGQMMPMLPFPAFPTGPNTQHYQHFESSKSESKTATGPGTTPADNYNVNSSTSWSSGNPPPNFNPNAPFGGGVFG
ncbi:unnamed protein product, partial [Mesorhabditis spiculigera]